MYDNVDLCALLDIDEILLSAHCGTPSMVLILLGHEQAYYENDLQYG